MSNQPSASLANYNVRQIDAERLVTSLSSNPTLVSLVTSAGLLETLKSNAGTITVLVPPEQTLKSLPSTVTNYLTNNKDVLRQILLYHVIDNSNKSLLYPPTIKIATLLIPPDLVPTITSLSEMTPSPSENIPEMKPPQELSSLPGMLPGATIGNVLGPMPVGTIPSNSFLKGLSVPHWLRKSGPGNNWT